MKVLKNIGHYEILLASGSPRRKELLGLLGLQFSILSGKEIDESYPPSMPLEEVTPYLSLKKAEAYLSEIKENQLVITADTIVINQGMILGKPTSKGDAIAMLKTLSGHTHKVITGVTISTKAKQVTFSEKTDVEFANLEDVEITEYVEKFMPLDKAGAYGIQEWIGCIGIKNIRGCFYNVMGLPLHKLYTELKKF